jgi:hypothetical protein
MSAADTNSTSGGCSDDPTPLQVPAGAWISVRKGRMIYRGQLLVDHDSQTKPDVKITSNVAAGGYRYLTAPVEIFIVGNAVIH